MQSTGHSSMHALSLTSTHGWAITYVTDLYLSSRCCAGNGAMSIIQQCAAASVPWRDETGSAAADPCPGHPRGGPLPDRGRLHRCPRGAGRSGSRRLRGAHPPRRGVHTDGTGGGGQTGSSSPGAPALPAARLATGTRLRSQSLGGGFSAQAQTATASTVATARPITQIFPDSATASSGCSDVAVIIRGSWPIPVAIRPT